MNTTSPQQHIKLEKNRVFPSKIVCVGRNYAEHIRELDNEMPAEPVLFIKPTSAISEQLLIPADGDIHYEGEITFLVKNRQLHAVGFGMDLTKRQLQSQLKAKGLPWEKAKAFDGSAAFSSFVPLTQPLENLRMELWINNELRQQGDHALMINKPDQLLTEIQRHFTLNDNDLVMTGTPKGVGEVRAGDYFTGKIYAQEQLLTEASWTATPKS